jgi:Asp-tRNA(Asn)/Glu-tRNA(Gln) amidotransferase A subunit family amidase
MLDAIRLRSPLLYPLPPRPDSFLNELRAHGKLNIAMQRQHPLGADIHPEVDKALEETVRLLEAQGHKVNDQAPPVDYRALSELTGTLINTHVAQSILPQLAKRGVDLGTPLLEEATRRMAGRGAQVTAMDYLAAIDGIRQVALQMEAFFEEFDVLVSPVLSQPPAPLGWLNMNSTDMKTYVQRFSRYSGWCALFNATGQPSISLPIHQSGDGLPIGVMFSARWGADGELLKLAHALEQQVQWINHRPAL